MIIVMFFKVSGCGGVFGCLVQLLRWAVEILAFLRCINGSVKVTVENNLSSLRFEPTFALLISQCGCKSWSV